MRITNVWNSLPFSVVTAPPVKIDWINTGHYKNLNTIGKQNYQELGVEAELNFEFFEFLLLHVLNNDIGIEALCFRP